MTSSLVSSLSYSATEPAASLVTIGALASVLRKRENKLHTKIFILAPPFVKWITAGRFVTSLSVTVYGVMQMSRRLLSINSYRIG